MRIFVEIEFAQVLEQIHDLITAVNMSPIDNVSLDHAYFSFL